MQSFCLRTQLAYIVTRWQCCAQNAYNQRFKQCIWLDTDDIMWRESSNGQGDWLVFWLLYLRLNYRVLRFSYNSLPYFCERKNSCMFYFHLKYSSRNCSTDESAWCWCTSSLHTNDEEDFEQQLTDTCSVETLFPECEPLRYNFLWQTTTSYTYYSTSW